jgi:hypothetical protein
VLDELDVMPLSRLSGLVLYSARKSLECPVGMKKADMGKARLMEKCFGFGDMWDEKNVKKIEIPIGGQRGKGSIKGEVIREHHLVGPQADRERGQGRSYKCLCFLFNFSLSAMWVYYTSLGEAYRFFCISFIGGVRYDPTSRVFLELSASSDLYDVGVCCASQRVTFLAEK